MIPICTLMYKQIKKGPVHRIFIRWQFEPRDAWIGVYWQHYAELLPMQELLNVYICVLPFLPLFVQIEFRPAGRRQDDLDTDR